jgi:hypothetical protein
MDMFLGLRSMRECYHRAADICCPHAAVTCRSRSVAAVPLFDEDFVAAPPHFGFAVLNSVSRNLLHSSWHPFELFASAGAARSSLTANLACSRIREAPTARARQSLKKKATVSVACRKLP